MNRKLLLFLLILVLAGGGYYYWRTHLSKEGSSSFLMQEKITIQGKEYTVTTREKLEELGLEQRLIPNKDNAAILYVKAINAYEKLPEDLWSIDSYVRGAAWTNDRRLKQWFDRNEECRKLLHKAVEKKDCQFPYFGKGGLIAALMKPYLSPMRGFARLLALEGKWYENKGDYSKAVDSYLAVGEMSAHLTMSESDLISHMVAVAMYSIMDVPLEMLIANNDISRKQLRKIVEECGRLEDHLPNLRDCLKHEKLSGDEAFEMYLSNPGVAGLDRNYVRRYEKQLRGSYEQTWEALEKWVEMPSWEALRSAKSFDSYLDRLGQAGRLTREILPSYDRAIVQFAKAKALIRGVVILAAIKLYEKGEGHPPRSLDELEDEGYITELPKDPFSGRDSVYRVRGRGWIFYSVWENLVDNGGAGAMPHNQKPAEEGGDGDLVFWSGRIPHKEPPR